MRLMISNVAYAPRQPLTDWLHSLGWQGDCVEPRALSDADSGFWLLFHCRPEIAVAHAVMEGESATRALALWEFDARQLLNHYRHCRDRSLLVDVWVAVDSPAAVAKALANDCPELVLAEAVYAPAEADRPVERDVDHLALLLACQQVAQTPSIKPLLAELDAMSVTVGSVDREAVPALDIERLQSALQGLVKTQGARDEGLEKRQDKAPSWLLRQLFSTQEQLNRFYLREQSAYAELEEARRVAADLNAQNARLKEQVVALERDGPSGIRLVGQIKRRLSSAFGGGLRRRRMLRHQMALVRESGYFDPQWYVAQNADIREAGSDPLRHFVVHGGQEGRAPGPRFDCVRYLARNPDVAEAGMNPLVHYLSSGRDENRPL